MTLHTIWGFLSRWRWVLIPGLVVSLLCAGAAFFFTPISYTVSSSYLFLSPVRDAETGAAGNPLLQLGNGVSGTVDVLAVSVMNGETVRKYTAGHPNLEYTAGRDTSVAAPLMVVTVTDSQLSTAESTLGSLETELGQRLAKLQQQAGAPRSQWVTMKEITRDPEPELGFVEPVRNAVLAFLVAGLVLFGGIGLRERRRSSRSLKERERAESSSEADAERQVEQLVGKFGDPAATSATPVMHDRASETRV
ncbi:hypothetical protein GCM10027052_24320 [Parafrigoribacterium mesophilum]|uniref:hypothetical protein n=1 Tax=Parafrigoribacterium mesophilum TaxID=433646 RepID=UPI0031FD3C05